MYCSDRPCNAPSTSLVCLKWWWEREDKKEGNRKGRREGWKPQEVSGLPLPQIPLIMSLASAINHPTERLRATPRRATPQRPTSHCPTSSSSPLSVSPLALLPPSSHLPNLFHVSLLLFEMALLQHSKRKAPHSHEHPRHRQQRRRRHKRFTSLPSTAAAAAILSTEKPYLYRSKQACSRNWRAVCFS